MLAAAGATYCSAAAEDTDGAAHRSGTDIPVADHTAAEADIVRIPAARSLLLTDMCQSLARGTVHGQPTPGCAAAWSTYAGVSARAAAAIAAARPRCTRSSLWRAEVEGAWQSVVHGAVVLRGG